MRAIFTAIFLFASTLMGADMTNGVFYTDTNAAGASLAQNGVSNPRRLEAGHTYSTGVDTILEVKTTNAVAFFFSGGPLVQTGTNAEFAVLLFDQEIENIGETPRKAKFGSHMLNLSLTKGDFSIVYFNKDANSRVNVNTQYADYELVGGKYFFRISGKSALVYVLEGGMTAHGDKGSADTVDKGTLAVAVPFGDAESGLEDKIVSSYKKAKTDETEKFASPVLVAEKRTNDIGFFVVDGKVVGILLK